ncbi:hypothetical protein K525DRAFT_214595 [Schizophyllum commune Loenen D]|nr:hypothetical protein K525DRAFT_214595 [Schizophyllum commune Loenen D]
MIILSSGSRSSKYPRLEAEAVEGVDDDVRMPDRSPGPAIRRVVAARFFILDHYQAAPPAPLAPPAARRRVKRALRRADASITPPTQSRNVKLQRERGGGRRCVNPPRTRTITN